MSNSIQEMKDQAARLRAELKNAGNIVSHSRSLELVARQKGFRDWNTALAVTGNRPSGPPVVVGQSVRGEYLGQPFSAKVLGIQSQLQPDRWRLTLELDEAVDVVKFDSFSSFRKRISATIGGDRRTVEKTSNGVPQLTLHG